MDDLISRQAAKDMLWNERQRLNAFMDECAESNQPAMRYSTKIERNQVEADINILDRVPSAQPEIIRCTECKHYREYDSKYVENAVVVQCMADRYPISEIIPDGWFCAGAERKDDE